LMQDDTERIQKHDLDVEDDEEHRYQVEADREALPARGAGRDAGLERDPTSSCTALRSGRQDERPHDHRGRNRGREYRVDQERQPVVEQAFPPAPSPWRAGTYQVSAGWHERDRNPWKLAGDRCYKVPKFRGMVPAEDLATMRPWQPSSSRLSSRSPRAPRP